MTGNQRHTFWKGDFDLSIVLLTSSEALRGSAFRYWAQSWLWSLGRLTGGRESD